MRSSAVSPQARLADAANRTAAARPASRLAWLSLAFGSLYWLSNRLTGIRSDIGDVVFEWERAIPFVEWTIIPYVSICGFFALSFFIGRDANELDRHVRRLQLALLISVACYAVFPLRFGFERPATTGLPGLLFSALTAFDLPYNRAPSLHIGVLAILWVRFAPHLTGWLRLALHAWFTLIAVSVLTTYQHHVIDVPAGLLVGGLCIVLTRRVRLKGRRWPASGATASTTRCESPHASGGARPRRPGPRSPTCVPRRGSGRSRGRL